MLPPGFSQSHVRFVACDNSESQTVVNGRFLVRMAHNGGMKDGSTTSLSTDECLAQDHHFLRNSCRDESDDVAPLAREAVYRAVPVREKDPAGQLSGHAGTAPLPRRNRKMCRLRSM